MRALESGRPDALLVDKRAQELVDRIDFNFPSIKMHAEDQATLVMRVNKFDLICRRFLAQNPAGMVVHIGCGLDTRFDRVDNGQVSWFDLDLPEVIALRESLGLAEKERYQTIACSAFDTAWMQRIRPGEDQKLLILSEGVFQYFDESSIKGLVLALLKEFAGCELAFDGSYPLMIWLDNFHLVFSHQKARLRWGFKDPAILESWAGGIKLLDAMYYFDNFEPRLEAMNWMRAIPGFKTCSGIFLYRLGKA
jgi:O-methyltransferase involved in polyketide biosynthesis